MIDNFVASEDPPPGAWNHHSTPQSPFGKTSFPEILVIPRGDIYTRAGEGQVVQHILVSHEWLPWRYSGSAAAFQIERAVARDIWTACATLKKSQPALAIFECRCKKGVHLSAARTRDGLCFSWEDLFDAHLTFHGADFDISDDPASLLRRFAGFDDVQINSDFWRTGAWDKLQSIWVGVPFRRRLEVQFSVVKAGARPPRRMTVSQASAIGSRRWHEFFRKSAPAIPEGDPVLRDAYCFAWQVLWANRCEGGSTGGLSRPYISPSRLNYGSQWWWDEAFHLVITRHLRDASGIYRSLDNFFRTQSPDGKIRGAIRFALTSLSASAASVDHADMDMQPPVIGLVLQLLKDKPGWPADLSGLYEPLLRWARWLSGPARDSDRDGLVEYHHSFDSSADQTQRWDSQLLTTDRDVGPLRPTESVDCNVWMSLLWQDLADMARQLGKHSAARAHEERSRRLFALIDEHMWDEKDGFYYDIDGATHAKIPVRTPYGFMPLLSSHIRPERAERLVRGHLLNPAEFWCRHPLPSASLDTPDFDPVNMWRGPSWINVNWMVVEGLHRQGYDREARLLARRTVETVGSRYRRGRRIRSPHIWEWYQPHTGRPLGNNNFSWSALVIDLIIRFLAPAAKKTVN